MTHEKKLQLEILAVTMMLKMKLSPVSINSANPQPKFLKEPPHPNSLLHGGGEGWGEEAFSQEHHNSTPPSREPSRGKIIWPRWKNYKVPYRNLCRLLTPEVG
jgi:hypothetical protein